jgi:hypothetical protein
MNRNLVGSIYGRFSIKIAQFVPIHLQTWPPQAILVSDWSISKNLLLWISLAKWTETWKVLYGNCIPFWSVNKLGRHRQFLFLIGRFLKQNFLWNRLA